MKIRAVLALTLSSLALPALASTITLNTRFSGAGAAPGGTLEDIGAYYQDTVNTARASAPTAGYCDMTLTDTSAFSNWFSCGGSNSNIAMHVGIDFNLASATSAFGAQFGVDFGHGGALFLDGVLLDARVTDMWWDGSYGDASQHFAALGLNLAAGSHHFDLFGLEGCCDGLQQARFQLSATAPWQVFGSDDGLNGGSVPVPATLPLAALGLGLMARRRKA